MRIAIACLLAGLAVGSAGAEQKRIILPPDHEYARLKAGPGSDVTQTQCQFCPSTDCIVIQRPGDAKQWEGVAGVVTAARLSKTGLGLGG